MSYELAAQFYDFLDQKGNIAFFYHYAACAAETLDIGAGTGRIAIPLAERGVKVCCVEPSPAMRKEFQKKLLRRPELSYRIQLIPGDAASFKVKRTFPLAILSGCFDHFLSDEQRVTSLENISRHLTPGGLLVFDIFLGLMEDHPLSPAGEAKVGCRTIRRLVGAQILSPESMKVDLIYEIYIWHPLWRRDRAPAKRWRQLPSRFSLCTQTLDGKK